MKTELACSLDRKLRLTERNFWFSVESHSYRGWRARFKTRDRKVAERAFKLACDPNLIEV